MIVESISWLSSIPIDKWHSIDAKSLGLSVFGRVQAKDEWKSVMSKNFSHREFN